MNTNKNITALAIEFLGLKKNMAVLLVMVIFVGLGEKMAERFLPLYLVALGGGIFSVGLLNGMDNLLSALYSYPGGYLSDRLGYKRALILFNLLAMVGFLIVIIFPVWQAVIIGSIFFLSWTAISLPAIMAMVSEILPKNKRTMGVSLHSLSRRIPMALGPVLGGILIQLYGKISGVRLAFIVAFCLAAISLILQQILVSQTQPGAISGKKENSHKKTIGFSPALKRLLVSDILIRFCEQIPYAFVVLWCVNINNISPVQFGLLTAIEMVVALLIYIPVAYFADKSAKKPFVLMTFGFFALFPLILLFSHSFEIMIIAFIVRGLKEFGEPTRKALIMDLAPEGQKARAFGLYYLIRDIIVSIAAFGGAFLWDAGSARFLFDNLGSGHDYLPYFQSIASPQTNFLVAFGFGLAGALYFAIWGKDLNE